MVVRQRDSKDNIKHKTLFKYFLNNIFTVQETPTGELLKNFLVNVLVDFRVNLFSYNSLKVSSCYLLIFFQRDFLRIRQQRVFKKIILRPF